MQDACPNPDDLLPGLCALAQRWLADVALPGFRDAPSQAGSLADWFDDRRVALYLQVIPCDHLTLAAYPSVWSTIVCSCMPWPLPQVTAPHSTSQTNCFCYAVGASAASSKTIKACPAPWDAELSAHSQPAAPMSSGFSKCLLTACSFTGNVGFVSESCDSISTWQAPHHQTCHTLRQFWI